MKYESCCDNCTNRYLSAIGTVCEPCVENESDNFDLKESLKLQVDRCPNCKYYKVNILDSPCNECEEEDNFVEKKIGFFRRLLNKVPRII